MKVSEKVTKTEALLLAMTLVFLLLTGAIFVLRSRSGGAEDVVRNETMLSLIHIEMCIRDRNCSGLLSGPGAAWPGREDC